MRVGIITFHFVNNYGGVLQTFALQKTIRLDKAVPHYNEPKRIPERDQYNESKEREAG